MSSLIRFWLIGRWWFYPKFGWLARWWFWIGIRLIIIIIRAGWVRYFGIYFFRIIRRLFIDKKRGFWAGLEGLFKGGYFKWLFTAFRRIDDKFKKFKVKLKYS